LISQPSAITALQSAKPALQAPIAQPPCAHMADALGGGAQTWPQAPQLLRLLEVLVSQPLLTLWSQSLKPELQA